MSVDGKIGAVTSKRQKATNFIRRVLSGRMLLNPPAVENFSPKFDQALRIAVQLGDLAGPVMIEHSARDQSADCDDVGLDFDGFFPAEKELNPRRVQPVVSEFVEADEQPFGAAQFIVEENLRPAVAADIYTWLFERDFAHDDAGAIAVVIEIVLSQNSDVPLRWGILEQQISTHGDLSPLGDTAGPSVFR